jgi:hypothetical protein
MIAVLIFSKERLKILQKSMVIRLDQTVAVVGTLAAVVVPVVNRVILVPVAIAVASLVLVENVLFVMVFVRASLKERAVVMTAVAARHLVLSSRRRRCAWVLVATMNER